MSNILQEVLDNDESDDHREEDNLFTLLFKSRT